MLKHEKESPFYITEGQLSVWKNMTLKQLEDAALKLTGRIDELPVESVSIKEKLTDALRQLDYYIEVRKEQEAKKNDESSTDNRR